MAELFGQSVTVSQDERWLYVGAPGANAVYAYGRVDWERQRLQTLGDGVTTQYYIGNIIKIDADTQLIVVVAGATLILGTDYTVTNTFTNVAFTTKYTISDPRLTNTTSHRHRKFATSWINTNWSHKYLKSY